jgi:hypothetical protein
MFTVGLKCKYLRSFLFRRYQMNSGGIYFLLDSISPATTIAENASENDKLSIEIDTLHWILSQCLSIRRLLKGQESELSYDTTTITKGLTMVGNKKRKSYHSHLILNFM